METSLLSPSQERDKKEWKEKLETINDLILLSQEIEKNDITNIHFDWEKLKKKNK